MAKQMRAQVHQTIVGHVPKGAHVLDVGCGAGCDTAWLVAQGYQVTAMDASVGMVKQSKIRVPKAHVLHASAEQLPVDDIKQPIDAVLLNFGVINAIDPVAFIQSLEALVHSQTVLIVVSMPRFHMAWVLRLLTRGHLRRAWQRCRPEIDIDVHGQAVRTRYWNRSELQERWPRWRCTHHQGLGMLIPPQSRHRASLKALECRMAHLPVVWEWGDHALTVWRQI